MTPYSDPTTKHWLTRIILLFLLTSIILTGCSLQDMFIPQEQAAPTSDSTQETVPNALVSFFVKVPANTPPDQPVLLSILDEVTGLALNAKRYPMESTGDGTYVIEIPFKVGTTVQYRYSRRGEVLAEEHTSDGRAVRYRMYHVTAPGEVHDVISRWNDTRFEEKTGRITGFTTDAVTGQPIPGLLVTAGGAQAITSGDGGFLIEGLPPGTHNIVVYALDGAYRTFQHGAVVAAESSTPAPIQLSPSHKVDITFVVNIPSDSPPVVPLRMAGNLFQLGNTFADLSGGVSTLASKMPLLSRLPDGTYGVILGLPAGADIRYKYTLGDGFWNSERANNGDWVIRQMIVPEEPVVFEDTVQTWQFGDMAPITFDINIPGSTPASDQVFIQFNPYSWMEPIPMWHLGGERWAYILYSPLDMLGSIGYRYCRAGQCGHADDARTPGVFTSGQVVRTSEDAQGLPDEILEWAWLEPEPVTTEDLSGIVLEETPNPAFFAGVEFQERYHPSWLARFPFTLSDITALGANWLVLTPSWTFTRLNPPVLEPVTGQDPIWLENMEMVRQARNSGLQLAMRPVPHFPTQVGEWWASAPKDFSWWVSWFDRYKAFAIHHADLAERSGVQTLILGGDWMSPALPGGTLADGSPSGVPLDAESRYAEIISEIRNHFSGTLGWALSYPEDIQSPPAFINGVDLLYVIWSEPLSDNPAPSLGEMQATAERILSTELYALWLALQMESNTKQVIISLAYPSIVGGTTRCLADPILACIPPEFLNYPAPDYPLLDLDLAIQERAYNAMLGAIGQNPFISGVVSRGYYPPTILHDKSTSIHGKPAEDVLRTWFNQFLAGVD